MERPKGKLIQPGRVPSILCANGDDTGRHQAFILAELLPEIIKRRSPADIQRGPLRGSSFLFKL